MPRAPRSLLAAAILVVGNVAACAGQTGITTDVSTDLPCDARSLTTRIEVATAGQVNKQSTATTTSACDPSTGRLASVVVVPTATAGDEVEIRVVTAIGQSPDACGSWNEPTPDGCIVSRRRIGFVSNEMLTLPIVMRRSCEKVTCGEGQTCIAGECAPAVVSDPSRCASVSGCGEGTFTPDGGLRPPMYVGAEGGATQVPEIIDAGDEEWANYPAPGSWDPPMPPEGSGPPR